jgi:hypothetical protein
MLLDVREQAACPILVHDAPPQLQIGQGCPSRKTRN